MAIRSIVFIVWGNMDAQMYNPPGSVLDTLPCESVVSVVLTHRLVCRKAHTETLWCRNRQLWYLDIVQNVSQKLGK